LNSRPATGCSFGGDDLTYLDGGLDSIAGSHYQAHLKGCGACQARETERAHLLDLFTVDRLEPPAALASRTLAGMTGQPVIPAFPQPRGMRRAVTFVLGAAVIVFMAGARGITFGPQPLPPRSPPRPSVLKAKGDSVPTEAAIDQELDRIGGELYRAGVSLGGGLGTKLDWVLSRPSVDRGGSRLRILFDREPDSIEKMSRLVGDGIDAVARSINDEKLEGKP